MATLSFAFEQNALFILDFLQFIKAVGKQDVDRTWRNSIL